MRMEILFLIGCVSLGLMLICWKLMISPAIRDRKVRALARKARRTCQPIEVTMNFIPIPTKFGFRPDAWNFDIQSSEQHRYFSISAFWTPTAVTKLQHGNHGVMYMEGAGDLVACCIETDKGTLLGTLSGELPTEPGVGQTDRLLKDDSWKRMRIV